MGVLKFNMPTLNGFTSSYIEMISLSFTCLLTVLIRAEICIDMVFDFQEPTLILTM